MPHGLREFLSQFRELLNAPLFDDGFMDDPPPIIAATPSRIRPDRVATIETSQILLALMPEDEWKEIERRVVPEA